MLNIQSNSSISPYAFTALIALCFYPLAIAVYNVWFHPLRKFPGPLLWRAFRLRFVYSFIKGDLVADVHKFHEKYGDVVRIAPNELSFAKGEAWQDMFSKRIGHKTFPKNPIFFKPPPGQPENVVSTRDVADHARMRKVMFSAFTERAVAAQEHIIQFNADLLTSKLTELISIEEDGAAVVDVLKWYNYLTFDAIGDLSFGESFNCLRDQQFHPWVAVIFNYLKGGAVQAIVRYYPLIEFILAKLVPPSIKKMQKDHYQYSLDRIHTRLNSEKKRNDFMTPIIEDNFENMTRTEVESTFAMLIIAGSETIATVLAGTTNYLALNPPELQKLVSEVRSTFRDPGGITFASVKSLPFLNAVVNEGLRLCNPTPAGLPRLVPEGGDTVCGHSLPEYTNVSVHPTSLFRSQQNFYRANDFLPDRWLPSSSRSSDFDHDNLSVVYPFGLGPRRCMGQFLAWAQMRLVLAKVVWSFDIDVAEGQKLDWLDLKTYIVVEKQPIMVKLRHKRS